MPTARTREAVTERIELPPPYTLVRLREGGEAFAHALGIAENTLVFFLGDNGSDAPLGHEHAVACAEPLRGKKGSHYEGGMRVPFIAAWAKPDAANEHQKRLPIAVNDAVEDVKKHAAYVTQARGGHGAVREVAKMILKAQDKWDKVLAKVG